MAELVTRPLDAVRQLFQQTGGSQAGDWGVRAAFEAALAEPAALAQVLTVWCADAWSDTPSMSISCPQLPSCTNQPLGWSISARHLHEMHTTADTHAAQTMLWCDTLFHTALLSF